MRSRRRVSLAATALLAAVALAERSWAASGPSWCLPPLFEGGQRLQAMPIPTAFWLLPLLRQHELCHAARAHPDEPRAILLGNSGVLGHPLPAEATLSTQLNRRLAERGAPGHVFNLAFVVPYQIRDAVILHAALDYHPDLIIYPMGLVEFVHQAPEPGLNIITSPVLSLTTTFFESNDGALQDLARASPHGLEEPLRLYAVAMAAQGRTRGYWARLQDIGALARAAAHAHAEELARWVGEVPPPPAATTLRQTTYDCGKTTAQEAKLYDRWQEWNVLAYLQQLHETDGIAVLVVNWPIAHEPVGDCYNARYSAAAVDTFNRWLGAECAARALTYVDLHDLLPAEEFFDSSHPTAEGHRLIAERLAPAVEAALRAHAPPGAVHP